MDTTMDTIPPPSSSGTDDPSPEAEGSTCAVHKLTLEYLLCLFALNTHGHADIHVQMQGFIQKYF